jgi:hypothetical protein
MKRTMRYLLPVLVMLATASCATYNRAAVQSVGDVAVVSIQCRRLVETGDRTDWAGLAKTWRRSEEFDLVPAAARIRGDLFGTYVRLLPFTFIDEQSLLASESYQGLGSSGIAMLPERDVTLPAGYLPVPLDNRKAVRELISRFPEVNGFLWAEVTYTLVPKVQFKGTDTAAMRADLTITILDRKSRGILRHTEIAEDDAEIRISAIAMVRTADIVSAADRATRRASAEMARWLEDRSSR